MARKASFIRRLLARKPSKTRSKKSRNVKSKRKSKSRKNSKRSLKRQRGGFIRAPTKADIGSVPPKV